MESPLAEYREEIVQSGEMLLGELTNGEHRYEELEETERVTLLRMAVLEGRTDELLKVIRARDGLMDDHYRTPGEITMIDNLLKVSSDADRIASRQHPADNTVWGEAHLREFESLACDARDAADSATLRVVAQVRSS